MDHAVGLRHDPHVENIMRYRTGQFFLVTGILLCVFFIITYSAQATNFLACLGGIVSLLLGIMLMLRNRPAPVNSERFQAWKKFQGRGSSAKPEKQD